MQLENPFKDSEDKLLFAKVLDRRSAVEKRHKSTFTDFLDPARCSAFLAMLLKHPTPGITPVAYGGYEEAERKMLGFQVEASDDQEGETFPITPVIITFNERFSKPLTHRDYLGSVLGLGIDRGKIGDIRLGEGGAVVCVSTEVASFICENLIQVKRTAVKAATNQTLPGIETTGIERRINVPSLRLDAVLGAAFNFSRGKAAALIESEKVYVNWRLAKKTHTINPGDAITVRGHGRVVIDAKEGTTKKDRIVLIITKY